MTAGTTSEQRPTLPGRAIGCIIGLLTVIPLLAAPPAGAVTINTQARTVQAARLSMAFSAAAPDVVSSLQWTDSVGTVGANLVENTGATSCGGAAGPQNFWGESYGDGPEGHNPELVFSGSIGAWTSPAANQVRTSTEYPAQCSGYAAPVPVGTTYTYYDESPQANEIAIKRTWEFSPFQKLTTTSAQGFRAYVPQLPLSKYGQVLYPAAGALQQLSVGAGQCQKVCLVESSGGWFASNDATPADPDEGSGVIVLRDPSDALAAKLAIQSVEVVGAGPAQKANLSSIDLSIPAGGLIAPITETEYLCFYDTTSWPPGARVALQLPAGCGPVAPPAGPTTPPPPALPASPGGAAPPAPGPRPPPPPGILHNFDIQPAGGAVRVRLPGAASFAPLSAAEQIPLGSIIDATHGTVQLTSAKDAHGHTETGLFYDGIFRVTQLSARSGVRGGQTVVLTVLTLVGPLPGGCGASTAKSGHTTVRRLWGNAKGNFRTVGHDASATVRGTKWLTEDTCAGTELRVARGVVSVEDFPHHRGFLLRAPHSFRAHPGKGG